MEKIYTICLMARVCIPLFSLVIGGIFDIFEGDLDGIFNLMDIGSGIDISVGICGIDFCILPCSLQCLSIGAVAEMLIKVLPDVAGKIAEPLSQIDKIIIMDGGNGEGNGVSNVAGNVTGVMTQVFESMKEVTGVDLADLVKAKAMMHRLRRTLI